MRFAQDEQALCEESGGIKMDGDEVMVCCVIVG
jgi:hypothetical protein